MSKTATGLVEFAKKARDEKWYYVYATYGQIITQEVLDSAIARYPNKYSQAYIDATIDGRLDIENDEVFNDRGTDCIGLIKAYLWWKGDNYNPTYVGTQDKSANGMYNLAVVKGDISTLPEREGIILHKYGHVGIYLGNGVVIEAKGVKYGVIESNIADTPWEHWFECPFIDYIEEVIVVSQRPTRLLSYGANGLDVQWIEEKLSALGYNAGVIDGVFDKTLDASVRQFQDDNNITIDGIVGKNTLASIDNPIIPVVEPVPVISTNPYPRPSLLRLYKIGSTGLEVKWIQWQLIQLGYLTADECDGIFGAITSGAVKKLQLNRNILVDGVVGKTTNEELTKPNIEATWASPYARPSVSIVIRQGNSGEGVRWIQSILAHNGYMLSEKTTGYFGSITFEAVKKFQANNGLTVDGKVGQNTNNKLQEYNK